MTEQELQHHGVKGMRWGVRRYQNKDGSLTPRGEKRMAKLEARRMAEDLKDRRLARKLSGKKAKQDMKADAEDRATARKIDAKKAKDEHYANRSASKKASKEELYDLPDTGYDAATQERTNRGRNIAMGALAAVGTVAAIYAFKKYRANKSAAAATEKSVSDIVKNKDTDKYYKNASKNLKKLRSKKAKEAMRDQLIKDGERDIRKTNIAKKISRIRKQNEKSKIDQARSLRKGIKNFNRPSFSSYFDLGPLK